MHKVKLVQEYVNENRRVELVFLPKSAPELNEIENKFSLLQREVLNNSNFRSAKQLEYAVRRWLSAYNRKGNGNSTYVTVGH